MAEKDLVYPSLFPQCGPDCEVAGRHIENAQWVLSRPGQAMVKCTPHVDYTESPACVDYTRINILLKCNGASSMILGATGCPGIQEVLKQHLLTRK